MLLLKTLPPGLSHGVVSNSLQHDMTAACEKSLGKKDPWQKKIKAKMPHPETIPLEMVLPGLNIFGTSVRRQVTAKKAPHQLK